MNNLKINLKTLRKQKGLSQEDLGEKLSVYSVDKLGNDLGFKRGAVASWEHGIEPPLVKLQLIADYFGVTVDDLMVGNPDPKPEQRHDYQEIFEIFKEEIRFKNRMIDRLMTGNGQK